MAFDTIRTQKMRSALTILGVLIGITSIVGMTSMVRGFDESLRETIRTIGPDTVFVIQFSGLSMSSGDDLFELMQRPSLTPADARAIARQAPSISSVNVVLGEGGPPTQRQLQYRNRRTKSVNILGSTENFADVSHVDVTTGRFFTPGEVSHRRRVVVLGQTPYQALFPHVDPVGILGPRPSPGGLGAGQDDFVVIPHTAYQKQFGIQAFRAMRGQITSIMIAAVPHDDVEREDALRDVESVMRIRHGLRLDEPNDFDILTQESAMRLWDQISSATYLALVSISSIALLVGGIGVMAIMTISVTERTREIGTRKALGARRREILWQFLLEAVVLTGIGGLLGIVFGSALGVGVHYVTDFPISLPWWSYAIGIGFSASVGIVFGLFPAIRASGLDPIEALRYE
jgi:putative ABC transport system permease protein